MRSLLQRFKDDGLHVDEVLSQLRDLPFQDLDFAKIDHHRTLRKGFPEVVFGEGKSPGQVAAITEAILHHSDRVLVTRTDPGAFEAVRKVVRDAEYDETSRTIRIDRRREQARVPGVLVVCGGTSDLPVASEASVTAEMMDCDVTRVFDVGVAGIHRLLDHLSVLQEARVVVAVAGMEGALPSVVGGLVRVPVIAVPTSVGYGANFGGLAALLAMLNSCSPGVSVVNIDNGFGAGYLAALIAGAATDSAG